jgi:hypothetical protein
MSRPKTARLDLLTLEDRTVPSAAPLDLTSPGAVQVANDAVFVQTPTQPTGTGFIRSFARLQGRGNQAMVQGYNTDARPLQYDENNSPQFTRGLPLSEVPRVTVGGVYYRQFLLDINQKSSQPYLSLDELRIYTGGAGNLKGYDPAAKTLTGLSAVYDLDAGGDKYVKLDARLTHGSGSGDMYLYVPDALFTGGGNYVYLYSKFGDTVASNGGFEEWAVSSQTQSGTSSIVGTVTQGTVTSQVPVAGAFVFIDANSNGVFDTGEAFTNTDANGNYSFTGLVVDFSGTSATYQVGIETGQSILLTDFSLAFGQTVTADFNIPGRPV